MKRMNVLTNKSTVRPSRSGCVIAMATALFYGPVAWIGPLAATAQEPTTAATPAATHSESDEGHDHGSPHKEDGHAHESGAADGEAGHEHGGEEGHDHGAGHADEVRLTANAIQRNGIRVAQAKPNVLAATIHAPARVAYNAEQIAHIGSVVTGRIAELKARVGDQIKKGDVLLVIDSAELGEAQSDFLRKRTSVEIARPAVDLAKDAYERAKQLYDKSQGIALTEVQTRQREFNATRGELLSAETEVTAAENTLHLLGMDEAAVENLSKTGEINPKYTVRAPIGGRVIERETTLGELVGPDKEKLMVIANLATVWVLADVPEAELGQIATGANVEINVPAFGDRTFAGTVSYISSELNSSTRTARIRIEVQNPETKLLPGMFARAQIAAGSGGEEPVITVPEEAVQNVEGEPVVFVPVKGEPNTFSTRQVGVGDPINGVVPILAGLDEGESYVASGSFILKAELGKAGAAHEH